MTDGEERMDALLDDLRTALSAAEDDEAVFHIRHAMQYALAERSGPTEEG